MKAKLSIIFIFFSLFIFSSSAQTVSEALGSLNITAQADKSKESASNSSADITNNADLSDQNIRDLINFLGDDTRLNTFKKNLELIEKSKNNKTAPVPPLTNITNQLSTYIGSAFVKLYQSAKKLPEAQIRIAPVKKIKQSEKDGGGYKEVWQWKALLIYFSAGCLFVILSWFIINRLFYALYALLPNRNPKRKSSLIIFWFLRIIFIILPVIIIYIICSLLLYALIPHPDDIVLRNTVLLLLTPFISLAVIDTALRLAIAPHHANYRLIPLRTSIAIWLIRRFRHIYFFLFPFLMAYQLTDIPRPPSADFNHLLQFITGCFFLYSLIGFVFSMRRIIHLYYRHYRNKLKQNKFFWFYDWIVDYWHIVMYAYLAGVGFYWFLGISHRGQWLISNTLTFFTNIIFTIAILRFIYHLGNRMHLKLAKRAKKSYKLKKQSKSLTPFIHYTASAFYIIVILLNIISVIASLGFNSFSWLKTEMGSNFLNTIMNLILIGLSWVLIKAIVSTVVNRYLTAQNEDGLYLNHNARIRTVLPLLKNIFLIVLATALILITLSVIGVNITPFLAGAGVLGIAIGFGSQKIVADFITGMFNLIEDTMQVGDVVEVNGLSGSVEKLSIRSLKLRDLAGHVHTIPFGSIEQVSNLTKDFSYALMEIGIGYRENVDDVMAILSKVGADMFKDDPWCYYIMEELDILGLDSFGDSSVNIKCRFKTRPGKKWSVAREFNRRIKNRFDELDIEIPYPHMTMYFGADKQGNAPPLYIQNKKDNQTEKPSSTSPKNGPINNLAFDGEADE